MVQDTYQSNDMAPPPGAPPARQGPPQVDYRTNPSDPCNGGDQTIDTYDRPAREGRPASPPVDQTWKSYDEKMDATRYGGLNSPEIQQEIFAEPDPANANGFSPSLADALAWERAEDGAPA